MSDEKKPDSLPLFAEEGEGSPPSEAGVLRHLAQTLSVTKTLKRFPSLTAKELQGIFLRWAERAEENQEPASLPSSKKEPPGLSIYADGASRGNPGDAAVGVVITDSRGRTLVEIKRFLGTATNNVAEYQAVILGLKKALELGAKTVSVYLDSELVVRQLQGEYRVLDANLKVLHQRVKEILNQFSQYSILHIPREENRRADQLANEAINQRNNK